VSQIQYMTLPAYCCRSTRVHSVSKMQSITNITVDFIYCYHGVWKYNKNIPALFLQCVFRFCSIHI